jgi:hypothetical protein
MKYHLCVLLLIAVGLLALDRYVRIQPLLDRGILQQEGFKSNTGTLTRKNGVRCGVDLFPCAEHLRCANGMCMSYELTTPVEKNPLPVLP